MTHGHNKEGEELTYPNKIATCKILGGGVRVGHVVKKYDMFTWGSTNCARKIRGCIVSPPVSPSLLKSPEIG